MYAIPKSQNYSCPNCKVKISVSDIDEIFQSQLQGYLGGISLSEHIEQAQELLQERKVLLDMSNKERAKLGKRMDDLIALRLDGGLSKERYTEQYTPLEARIQQLDKHIPQLEAEIDVMTIQLLSSDTVMAEAKTLNEQWHELSFEQRRGIIESILVSLVVDKDDITINLAYAPDHPPDGKNLPATMSLWLLQSPGKGVYLPTRNGAKIPEQNIGPAAGPYRFACGSNACKLLGAILRTPGRKKRSHPRTRHERPRNTNHPLRQ
jgi:site-specific DNA recombinase